MANKKKRVMKKSAIKKRRIKIIPFLIFLFVILISVLFLIYILSKPISNIYISGNSYYTDQQIIELAGLSSYPATSKNPSFVIKKRLENDNMILGAKVSKKKFTQVYIKINDNYPLFYNTTINKTILFDEKEVDENLECGTLINYVPDTIYPRFLKAMKLVNYDVLKRISEIKYYPNEVDEERFLLLMDDSNYVYITLEKIESINNYINIIKNFDSKTGVLYLDSGEYFQILDN